VIATRNADKAEEIVEILRSHLAGLPCELLTLDDFPDYREPGEDGTTFAENALIKARAAADALGELAMADDAGLEIDALGGEPGLHSRRFAGDTTFEEKMALILARMRETPEEGRAARFQCAVAVAEPNGPSHLFEGTCEGRIAYMRAGTHGFGYDPIFWLEERGCTMAELPPAEKNEISHRADALRAAREALRRLVENGANRNAG
jgi:XTP/dITP diphosphohydrolase